MHSEDGELSREVQHAMKNERLRDVIKAICRSYQRAEALITTDLLQSDAKTSKSWSGIAQELQLQLLEKTAAAIEAASFLRFEDSGSDLSPLRNLWATCFRQFASKSILATSYVSPLWSSSSIDVRNLQIQRSAIARGVEIRRVFIASVQDDSLPERAIHELRYAALQQLNVGIRLYIIDPRAVRAHVRTGKLGTNDFIVFDDSVVYTTVMDQDNRDKRDRINTHVQIYQSEETLACARDALEQIMRYVDDELTVDNLAKYLDPYAGDRT